MITQSLAHGLLRWVDSLSSSYQLGNMRVGVLSNVQVVSGAIFVGFTLLNGRDWVYAVLLVPETRSIRTTTQEITFQFIDKNDPFHTIWLVSNLGGEKSLWQLRCVMSGKVKEVLKKSTDPCWVKEVDSYMCLLPRLPRLMVSSGWAAGASSSLRGEVLVCKQIYC